MSALLLLAALAAEPSEAEVAADAEVTAEPEETVAAPADPEAWPGEHRRVHAGPGVRVHGGLMGQAGAPFLVLQSELFAVIDVRLRKHDSLRVQLGLAYGYPDTVGAETNVSYRHPLNRLFTIGGGVFAYWGFWSMRAGVELPLALRLGDSRKSEITLALRAHAGVFNNITFVWWDFSKQRFAFAADLALGYAFIF